MVEILALAKRSAGELVREAGLRVILLAIQQEADALTGAQYQRRADRQALRWSQEEGVTGGRSDRVAVKEIGRRKVRVWKFGSPGETKGILSDRKARQLIDVTASYSNHAPHAGSCSMRWAPPSTVETLCTTSRESKSAVCP
jgi:hypothetical protein